MYSKIKDVLFIRSLFSCEKSNKLARYLTKVNEAFLVSQLRTYLENESFQNHLSCSSMTNQGRGIQDSLDSSLAVGAKLECVNSVDENKKVDGPHVRIQRGDIFQKLH